MSLSLTDTELSQIRTAAAPLDRDRRDDFMRAVVAELSQCPEIGPGAVHRVCRETQREFLRDQAMPGSGKYR